MLEEHLYWLMLYERWAVPENFRRGPWTFFKAAPAPLRPLVRTMVSRGVHRNLRAQGLARHNAEERAELGGRDLESLSQIMGKNRCHLGDAPCWADATLYSFLPASPVRCSSPTSVRTCCAKAISWPVSSGCPLNITRRWLPCCGKPSPLDAAEKDEQRRRQRGGNEQARHGGKPAWRQGGTLRGSGLGGRLGHRD